MHKRIKYPTYTLIDKYVHLVFTMSQIQPPDIRIDEIKYTKNQLNKIQVYNCVEQILKIIGKST